jgi:hypothetical protein
MMIGWAIVRTAGLLNTAAVERDFTIEEFRLLIREASLRKPRQDCLVSFQSTGNKLGRRDLFQPEGGHVAWRIAVRAQFDALPHRTHETGFAGMSRPQQTDGPLH